MLPYQTFKPLVIVKQVNSLLEYSVVQIRVSHRPAHPRPCYIVRIVKVSPDLHRLPMRVPHPESILPSRIHINTNGVTPLVGVNSKNLSLNVVRLQPLRHYNRLWKAGVLILAHPRRGIRRRIRRASSYEQRQQQDEDSH